MYLPHLVKVSSVDCDGALSSIHPLIWTAIGFWFLFQDLGDSVLFVLARQWSDWIERELIACRCFEGGCWNLDHLCVCRWFIHLFICYEYSRFLCNSVTSTRLWLFLFFYHFCTDLSLSPIKVWVWVCGLVGHVPLLYRFVCISCSFNLRFMLISVSGPLVKKTKKLKYYFLHF